MFKNTGKAPLIIKDADSSCGCTIPEIPKHPTQPGEYGNIKAVFNTKGKIGSQNKVITVYTNGSPSTVKLSLSGLVLTEDMMD